MSNLSGALIAMSLVLCAVFVPVSFLGGITGQLYRQFTVTIAVSVIISTIVALTLSPVMCAKFLKPDSGNARTSCSAQSIMPCSEATGSMEAWYVGLSVIHAACLPLSAWYWWPST